MTEEDQRAAFHRWITHPTTAGQLDRALADDARMAEDDAGGALMRQIEIGVPIKDAPDTAPEGYRETARSTTHVFYEPKPEGTE